MATHRQNFHAIIDKVLDGLTATLPLHLARGELVKVLAQNGASVFESRREAQLAVERYYRVRHVVRDDPSGAA